MATILKCKSLVAGHGRGEILTTHQSISFWGGVDPATGMIIDPRHELFDQSITAKRLITRLLKERVINHINTCCSISFNNKRIQRIKTANRSLLKNPTFRCIWICILKVSEIWRIFEITIHA